MVLDWWLDWGDKSRGDFCGTHASSVRGLLNRIRKTLPLVDETPHLGLLTDTTLGPAQPGKLFPLSVLPGEAFWKQLGRDVLEFARTLETAMGTGMAPAARGSVALRFLACARLGIQPDFDDLLARGAPIAPLSKLLDLRVTFDQVKELAEFVWSSQRGEDVVAKGRVRVTGADQLTWEIEAGGKREPRVTSQHRNSIRAELGKWLKRFPTNRNRFCGLWVKLQPGSVEPIIESEPPFGPQESPYGWIEDNITAMAEALRFQFSPLGRIMNEAGAAGLTELERHERRMLRKEQKRAEEDARRQETMARLARERTERERRKSTVRKAAEARLAAERKTNANTQFANAKAAPPARRALPPVPVRLEFPELAFQETAFPLGDLSGYFLRERAARWWVSNQSDTLLCLPHCRLERLDYQLRTALRVLGPMRGRALLSDEVGLGKTIEAGLVLKELLTRGMVKKFLILTVPSLVDQWEEELNDKFGLTTVTTNHAEVRNDPYEFWSENPGLVASLHTLKQPTHLDIARRTHWDLLVVDEAHYLRNRESRSWRAVNALPRQFLLLLTATPVQNSLEELYNLVTLLQPGQLPSPKEFRARFVDRKRPRQPREPEELRRLLGQVMIRNTRANAGLKLPPRRAETVLFEPDAAERAFWQQWEGDLRVRLSQFSANQTNL